MMAIVDRATVLSSSLGITHMMTGLLSCPWRHAAADSYEKKAMPVRDGIVADLRVSFPVAESLTDLPDSPWQVSLCAHGYRSPSFAAFE
jgi:hypothetical protein